ncbi:MAG: zf-HC2 domain-containing protein [Candidatus Latescibacteria bacterium]|nr:zf-HC2 domain-containing protein [Candidatus Latescibacterota bacterium]
MSCETFRSLLSAFVDGELTEPQKSLFLAHAESCTECNLSLGDLQQLKRMLKELTPVTVSPGFDSRMRSLIESENSLMQKPWHHVKLFLRDNTAVFVTVPAAAALIAAFVYFKADIPVGHDMTVVVEPQTQVVGQLEPAAVTDDSGDEVVHYVLDSVKQSEAEVGIFLNEQQTSTVVASNSNFRLISF